MYASHHITIYSHPQQNASLSDTNIREPDPGGEKSPDHQTPAGCASHQGETINAEWTLRRLAARTLSSHTRTRVNNQRAPYGRTDDRATWHITPGRVPVGEGGWETAAFGITIGQNEKKNIILQSFISNKQTHTSLYGTWKSFELGCPRTNVCMGWSFRFVWTFGSGITNEVWFSSYITFRYSLPNMFLNQNIWITRKPN